MSRLYSPSDEVWETAPLQFSSVLADPHSEIPADALSYFRAWIKDQFHDLVWREFREQKLRRPDLTQAEIARRLGKRPEQINRWLATPGNWTLETVSDLLLAIANCTAVAAVQPIELQDSRNHPGGPDWAAELPVAGPHPPPAHRVPKIGEQYSQQIPSFEFYTSKMSVPMDPTQSIGAGSE